MDYKNYFEKRELLTSGKSNTKTAKNSLESYYLTLQPTDLNSKKINLCKFSTKECRQECLQYAGRQGFSNVVQSRQRKTEFYINHPVEFITKLYGELEKLNKKGKCAVRLNLLSDVDWEKEFSLILPDKPGIGNFHNIQFYDYTKDHFKVLTNNLKNYNLTYSYSGGNWQYCEKFLKEGIANVAAVFKPQIPTVWNGFKVINGDLSDERFNDELGVIVGLRYKKPKGKAYNTNKFVIEI